MGALNIAIFHLNFKTKGLFLMNIEKKRKVRRRFQWRAVVVLLVVLRPQLVLARSPLAVVHVWGEVIQVNSSSLTVRELGAGKVLRFRLGQRWVGVLNQGDRVKLSYSFKLIEIEREEFSPLPGEKQDPQSEPFHQPTNLLDDRAFYGV